jgi:rhodanese-related sulfurtransferase
MKNLSPKELQQKLNDNSELLLVDVREDYEHEAYNIGGILLPLSDIMNHVDEIPSDKPVIVYCKKGIRSQIAIQRLEQKHGFTNLFNLSGGMEAWKKEFK